MAGEHTTHTERLRGLPQSLGTTVNRTTAISFLMKYYTDFQMSLNLIPTRIRHRV